MCCRTHECTLSLSDCLLFSEINIKLSTRLIAQDLTLSCWFLWNEFHYFNRRENSMLRKSSATCRWWEWAISCQTIANGVVKRESSDFHSLSLSRSLSLWVVAHLLWHSEWVVRRWHDALRHRKVVQTSHTKPKLMRKSFKIIFSSLFCSTFAELYFGCVATDFLAFSTFIQLVSILYAHKHPNSRLRAIERIPCRRSRHFRRRNLINFQFFFFCSPLRAQRKGAKKRRSDSIQGIYSYTKFTLNRLCRAISFNTLLFDFTPSVFLRSQCFSSSFALV